VRSVQLAAKKGGRDWLPEKLPLGHHITVLGWRTWGSIADRMMVSSVDAN
jgi:hypothetical protein